MMEFFIWSGVMRFIIQQFSVIVLASGINLYGVSFDLNFRPFS